MTVKSHLKDCLQQSTNNFSPLGVGISQRCLKSGAFANQTCCSCLKTGLIQISDTHLHAKSNLLCYKKTLSLKSIFSIIWTNKICHSHLNAAKTPKFTRLRIGCWNTNGSLLNWFTWIAKTWALTPLTGWCSGWFRTQDRGGPFR